MPSFDLRGIRAAKYNNDNGKVTYTEHCTMGDAMNMQLTLKHAEGRLYAESSLAEYLKLVTGGTLSAGVKYLPADAQKVLYGYIENQRTIGEKQVKSLVVRKKSTGAYVGVVFYAPDMIDGEEKFTAVFIYKALFGPPDYKYETKGETITFQTPTTTGEFLADNTKDGNFLEFAVLDTEEDAVAWCKLVLGETEAASAAQTAAVSDQTTDTEGA